MGKFVWPGVYLFLVVPILIGTGAVSIFLIVYLLTG